MRLGRGVWTLALVWAAVIFILSSIPGRALPNVPALRYDKLLHATVYGVLGGVIYLGARSTWPFRPVRVVLGCTLAAVLYGLSDEFHQRFVPGRSSDLWDVVADGVGGFAGALLAAVATTIARRGQRSAERAS
jgi:VanZ family protein